MKKTYIASIMLVLLSRATCDDYYSYEDTDEIDSAPSHDTSWRLNLQGSLRQRMALNDAIANTGESMVCSPISALFPLGKLVLGATGTCKVQLNDAIGVSSSSELRSSFRTLLKDLKSLSGVRLSICSRVYISKEYRLKSQFEEDAKDIFKSSIKRIDLHNSRKVADRINKWVNKRTNGMISEIIYPRDIAPDSLVILVNAVYFSGAWKDKFRSVETKTFYTPTTTRQVPMMTRDGSYNYVKNDALDCQVIEIPYTGGQASFVIFLPNTKDGLPILLYKLKLAPELMQMALDKMTMVQVSLSMPKFKTTTEINLQKAYEKLGLTDIFKPEGPCLKSIVKNEKDLRVSKAIQKAVIEVDEYGTRAAAASVMDITLISKIIFRIRFNANKPFYYMIKIKREIMFSGIYVVVSIALLSLVPNKRIFNANKPFYYMIKVRREMIFSGIYVVLDVVAVSLQLNNVIFNADHPFLYFVKVKNETVFVGTYETD